MRLRFTIHDLLWLTLVVALGLGWCLDRQELTRRILIIPDPPNPAAYDPSAEILPHQSN
jgi:hypothetical protein